MTKGQSTVAGLLAVAALAIAVRVFAQPASTGVTGVCCITNPISCIITTEADCVQQGGIYGGDGTGCGLIPPNPFGGCTCGPGAGNCTDPLGNGTPGCEKLQCCEPVCVIDPVCCGIEWDENCGPLASMFPVCTCPWDCQAVPSGGVDVPDLLALLGAWGGPQTPGTTCDFDGGGIAVPDLLKLLANWGPCP